MKRFNTQLLYATFFNLIWAVMLFLKPEMAWMFAGLGFLHLVGSFLYLSGTIKSLENRIADLEAKK